MSDTDGREGDHGAFVKGRKRRKECERRGEVD